MQSFFGNGRERRETSHSRHVIISDLVLSSHEGCVAVPSASMDMAAVAPHGTPSSPRNSNWAVMVESTMEPSAPMFVWEESAMASGCGMEKDCWTLEAGPDARVVTALPLPLVRRVRRHEVGAVPGVLPLPPTSPPPGSSPPPSVESPSPRELLGIWPEIPDAPATAAMRGEEREASARSCSTSLG